MGNKTCDFEHKIGEFTCLCEKEELMWLCDKGCVEIINLLWTSSSMWKKYFCWIVGLKET